MITVKFSLVKSVFDVNVYDLENWLFSMMVSLVKWLMHFYWELYKLENDNMNNSDNVSNISQAWLAQVTFIKKPQKND